MTGPHVLTRVHAKTQPAALGAMRRERTQPTQLMAPHALELEAVESQHLLDANALLEHTEIYPPTHAATSMQARIANGLPLLSTAIRYATSLRAIASVARLRFPRCTSRSCTAASCGL